jgi:hypothetical protein
VSRLSPAMKRVLTPEAIDFAVEFEREFGAERQVFSSAAPKSSADSIPDGSPL